MRNRRTLLGTVHRGATDEVSGVEGVGEALGEAATATHRVTTGRGSSAQTRLTVPQSPSDQRAVVP